MSNKSQWRTARTILCSFVLAVSVPRAFAQAEILGHEAYSRVAAQSRIGIWLGGNLAECEVPYVEQSDAWSSSLQNGPQTCGPVESYPGLSAMTDGGVTSVVSASATVITLNVNADGSAATIQPDPGYQLAFARADSVGGAWVEFRLRSSAYVTITYSIEAQFAADAGGWGSAGGCSAYVSAPFVYEGVNSNEEQSQSLGPILLTPDTYGAAASIYVNVSRDGYLGGATGTNTGGGSAQLTLSFTPVFGGCCFGSGNCLMLTLEDCLAQGGSYSGDEIPCESLSCRGACCLPSGNCVETSPTQCALSNGRYWGDGVDCSLVRCLGACCVPTGGCELTSRAECEQLEGTFHGEGSYCDFEYCPPVISIETTPLLTCPLTTARFRAIPSCGTPDEWWDFHWMRYSPQGWRWLEDDDRVSGSYSDTLQIENLRRSDAGYYRVAAYGWCGSVTSQDIVLRFKGENLENPADNADGDGIPDCWETEGAGMDVNDDGIRDLDLFDKGARPDRKDLFVEVDSMVGLEMDGDTALMVIRAFHQAPLSNPDGTTGISLHLDRSETPLPWSSITNTLEIAYFGSTSKNDWFGTQGDRDSSNKNHILAAKLKVYRYCIVVADLVLASGVAEIGGDDLCVAFAQEHTLDSPYYYVHRAKVFMHELGHSLGLWHNGAHAASNYNPVYPSVMNYNSSNALSDAWIERQIQRTGLSPVDDDETVWIDYCRLPSCGAQVDDNDTCLGTLDESSINEHDWVCYRRGVHGFWENWPVGYQDDDEMPAYQMVSIGCRPSGGHYLPDVGSPNYSLQLDQDVTQGVIQNLNSIPGAFPTSFSPLGQLHEPYNDWANIRYRGHDGGVIGLLAFTGEMAPIEEEASPEWLNAVRLLPTSRSDCGPEEFPRIEVNPVGAVVPPGATLYLGCAANGAPPFSYQWYKGDRVIAGATDANYEVTSVRYADAGEYKVLIANACGAVQSFAAIVTVPPIPGDLDLDGDVDLQDLAEFLSAFGWCIGTPEFNAAADIVADGCIDLLDLTQLLSQFGQW